MRAFSEVLETVKARVREVDVRALREWMGGVPPVILDCRQPEETALGTLEGALLIPRGLVELAVSGRVPSRDLPIVAVCAVGNRSALVADLLARLGYTEVASLAGGFKAWQASGAPFVIPPPPVFGDDPELGVAVPSWPSVSPTELADACAGRSAPLVIDVRESAETRRGVVSQARLQPLGQLESRVGWLTTKPDREIVVVSSRGHRAVTAARGLDALGYLKVRVLAGGMTAWRGAGLPVAAVAQLSDAARSRYARHLSVPQIGEDGQLALLSKRVLLVGAGGLGSAAATYLAAAGVGTLGIVDFDLVDRSNLQRQILHRDDQVGVPKVVSARATLLAINPTIDVVTHQIRLSSSNVLEIFEGYDLVVDGGDNFPTRYLVNDACVHLGIPCVHGSVYRFEGQATVFVPGAGPCYRCLYPEPPPPELAPSCSEGGVLGVVPGIIGLLQATEAIKVLLDMGDSLVGRLLHFDGLRMEFREMKLSADPRCPVCGSEAGWTGFIDYEHFCGVGE